MTSGFNSDIVLDGVVYHIQTEDRGSITAEIVTQIFREGAVIFTRRTPYPSNPERPNFVSLLEGLVRSQHMKLLQFVRSGGLSRKDLLEKAISGDHVEASSPSMEEAMNLASSAAIPDTPRSGLPLQEMTRIMGSGSLSADRLRAVPPRIPVPPTEPEEVPPAAVEPEAARPDSDTIRSIDELLQDFARQPPVGPTAPEDRPPESTVDQSAVDGDKTLLPGSVLASEASVTIEERPPLPAYLRGERCEIQLLSSTSLISGEIQPLQLRLRSDRQHLPIPDARITVRVSGTTIRPLSYSGWSDGEGLFSIDLIIPRYTTGNGCVEISAQTPLGSHTLKLDVACPAAAK